jgi:MPBQ/MSBQ methyltransferase
VARHPGGPQLNAKVPLYFDYLIEGFRRGQAGRHVHLGYWESGSYDGPAGYGEGEFARAQRRLDDVLLGMAALQDGQRVLDVGCGFGGTLESVSARFRGMGLAGVNVDPRQLAICREIAPAHDNRIEWHEADACSLPFGDAEFDRVLCFEAMFHFTSRREFFVEAARVLKKGGALVGSDLVVANAAKLPADAEAALLEGFGPWPDFRGRDADHAALAEGAGLRRREIRDVTRHCVPSHRFTTPADAAVDQPTDNVPLRAALMLRRLHEQGHLRYLCFRFEKP